MKKQDKEIQLLLAEVANIEKVYTSNGGYKITTSEDRAIYSGERGATIQKGKQYELFCYLSKNGN